jgi:hypothetical protein
VDVIPERPEAGVLYVSVEYATTLHLCACGCGHEVVLGVAPDDWKILWDGPTVSVSPSVGNWSLPCRSHYVIRRNHIQWERRWSNEEITRGRADARRKHAPSSSAATGPAATALETMPRTWWRRLLRKVR